MPWREGLKRYLLPQVLDALDGIDQHRMASLCEIRMYADREIELSFPWGWECTAVSLSQMQLQDQLAALSGHALYRYERQLAQGYIPLEAGCRVGVCGRMTRDESGAWRMIQATSICLRIGRLVHDAAEAIYPYLLDVHGLPQSVLIFGCPGCGKTTVLRDAAKHLAEKAGFHVAAADEREELFPPGGQTPLRMDVLSGCDKTKGMMLLLRSMAPQVIVCDEIGSAQDAAAIEEAQRCGTAVLATAHAGSFEALMYRPALQRLLSHGIFDRYVLLEHVGRVKAVFDRGGEMIWEEKDDGQLGCGGDGNDRGRRSGLYAL